jgi:NAD dependent epimerase/dehydratase family enzyme
MKALRQAARAATGLPSTRFMLELGAWFLRAETELILKSRRVIPGRLLQSGFNFQFPDWASAASDLVRRTTGRTFAST